LVERATFALVMRRSPAVAAVVVAALCGGASPAVAEPQALATVTANVPIAAGGGWVAWSAPGEGGWRLMAWHSGAVMTLPAAARPQPFDLDLGTDAHGRAVATFSRCGRTPVSSGYGASGDGRLAAWTGTGCRVRVLDLATGVERAVGIPGRKDSSDTTPSIWRGRIAFARRDRRHHDIAQVMLWSPRTRRLKTLRHGAISSRCPFRTGCRGMTVRGAVEGLDLGARLVTFLWWVDTPAVAGHGGWEVRADRLADGRSVRAGSGILGEVCADVGTDTVVPSVPAADGSHVWYTQLSSACYRNTASVVRFRVRQRKGASGIVPGNALQFAKGGGALYALVAPEPIGEVRPACDIPGAPCTIQRIERPALTKTIRRPGSPFF
jgi:hypothetical protein